MKKWAWSACTAFLVWAVGLKFSPEETVVGSLPQLRFEILALLYGGFIGLMFGLVATKGRTIAEERRKFLYSAMGCCSAAMLMTWGPSRVRIVKGALVGAAVGLLIAALNYLLSAKPKVRTSGRSETESSAKGSQQ
jgi:hypothetical protein